MSESPQRRVAVMQPYLFPYLGYFQLLHSVDQFVLLDDVAYIQKGWINRNRVLVAGQPWRFTLPLAGSSQNRLIQDLAMHPDGRQRRKLLATLEQTYRGASEFGPAFRLMQRLLTSAETDLTRLVQVSLEAVNDYVGLAVPLLRSSVLPKATTATGQQRIIGICHSLGATGYVNMEAGAALYDPAEFARQGLGLQLLRPVLTPYLQGLPQFVAGLSIIDVLMHNSPAQVRRLMQQGRLLPPGELTA